MKQWSDPPPLAIGELMRRYQLHPNKRLGQNFLVDHAALSKVVEAARVGEVDAVLEIGPGLGSLTRFLAQRAKRVVAVEIDGRLIPALTEVLEPYQNVTVIEGDILEIDPDKAMKGEEYLVAANIPYYITSAVIRHLLKAEVKPRRMVLTVQREVAERITAGPGEMSLLALSVQLFGKPVLEAKIPAGAFYPAPKVDSAIIRVERLDRPTASNEILGQVFRVAKAGFGQKRKKLRNSLAAGLALEVKEADLLLESAGINPDRRAETLTVQEWVRLAGIHKKGS